MKYLVLLILPLFISISTNAQIRTDYREGMSLPKKINLISIAPWGLDKLMLEKHEKSGYYRLYFYIDLIGDVENRYARLMNVEVKDLIKNVWGKSTLVQKKKYMKNFMISLGCTDNDGEIGYVEGRWSQTENEEYDEHIYPYEFENILTEQDIKHRYFGANINNMDLTEFLPKETNITYCGIADHANLNGTNILIQFNTNTVNTYYALSIRSVDYDNIHETMTENYPWKIKQNYLCGLLIDYNIASIQTLQSQWSLYTIPKDTRDNNYLAYYQAKPYKGTVQQAQKQQPQQRTVRAMLFDWLRSQIFTKEEQKWYNEHIPIEVWDEIANTRTGGNGRNVQQEISDKIERHQNLGVTY